MKHGQSRHVRMQPRRAEAGLKPVWWGVLAAAILWTIIFATTIGNFRVWMTIATVSLGGWALINLDRGRRGNDAFRFKDKFLMSHIIWGLVSAALLYVIFFVGDVLTSWVAFQDPQVTSIYGNKAQSPVWLIGLLLVFPIGPGEEIFWRGSASAKDVTRSGVGWRGYWIAGALYAAVICGYYWGLLYKLTGSIIPGIISHAVWDLSIFVLFPLR